MDEQERAFITAAVMIKLKKDEKERKKLKAKGKVR